MLLLFWSGLTQGVFIWMGPHPDRTAVVTEDERTVVVVN
jgi:hypothetical protein